MKTLEVQNCGKMQNILNKLGQRQSQTPFSSEFWVQNSVEPRKISIPKKFWVKKILVQKIKGQRKFPSPTSFGPEKI